MNEIHEILDVHDKPLKMFCVGDEYDITEYAVCWYCEQAFMVYFDEENYNRLWRNLDTGEVLQKCVICKSWNIVRNENEI